MALTEGGVKNVVLVHGAWVDGSGWQGVHDDLTARGYNVRVVQHPTASLADDVEYVKRALARLDGPAVLVGHSYGGVILSEAGNDPRVSALVYVTAFVPEAGESVLDLIADPPAGSPVPPILPPEDGFLYLDREKFPASFAADLSPEDARFMADAMPGWGVAAAEAKVSDPAWKSKPSHYLIARDDQMLAEPLQRRMAERAGMPIVEAPGSHAVYVSQPATVADLVEIAAHAGA
ncbi:alpha/beta hydrolase [Nocardioides sp. GXZ039]|uniref:alpha/beta hydrolase n=1 Tax=Nocardioides sp. GXZ039 TaxID=3136018 RepID=UPI0030F3F8F9